MSSLTATVIIATLAIVCTFATMIWATVTLRQTLREMSRASTRRDERHDATVQLLLDRLSTIKWENFVAMQAVQAGDEEGGFFTPEEQTTESNPAVVAVEEPGRWGPLSRQSRAQSLTLQEQQLLDEDFPDEVEK
jgi:hypothetical protein